MWFEHVQQVKVALGIHHDLPLDGEALHKDVSPEFWCVSRKDIRRLREIAKSVTEAGCIVPTSLDPFDPKEDQVGPCIHTITNQLIKPLTMTAGNCSWALMCCPAGRKCDLFITHCWQEGIFEFIDQVLASWPNRAACDHAYCCMLSNPQNLDIAGMISSPSNSPFARNLRSATHMLVIPNSKVSIYTRIWCVYEAFLAYTWGKTIYTASAPIHGFWFQMSSAALPGAVGFFSMCMLLRYNRLTACHLEGVGQIIDIFLSGLLIISSFSGPYFCVRIVNWLGILFAGVQICDSMIDLGASDRIFVSWDENDGCLAGQIGCTLTVYGWYLNNLAFFVAAEADRMWGIRAIKQSTQLMHGYTGRLRNAQSSSPSDKDAILLEIQNSGSEKAVDEAVNLLILAGMSTPSLQQAAYEGVNFAHFGRSKASIVIHSWGYWLLAPIYRLHWYPASDVTGLMNGLLLVQWLIGIVSFLRSSPDRQAFSSLCVMKVLFIGYLFADFISAVHDLVLGWEPGFARCDWYWGWDLSWFGKTAVFFEAGFLCPLTLLFSAMGPGKLACVPKVGPCLVQYILGSKFLFTSLLPCLQLHRGTREILAAALVEGIELKALS